jgi:uncharacterized protein (DUF1330 family)
MTAYVLFMRDKPPTDAAEMAIYNDKTRAVPIDPKLTPLALYGAIEALEGTAPDGVVMLQFPTAEDAKAWYHSAGYQAAAAHRKKGADYRVMIIQGL